MATKRVPKKRWNYRVAQRSVKEQKTGRLRKKSLMAIVIILAIAITAMAIALASVRHRSHEERKATLLIKETDAAFRAEDTEKAEPLMCLKEINLEEIAEKIGQQTKVRPALLLSVLMQESDFGANVGNGTWKKDMHPSHRAAFQTICKKLGKDPDKMPVSRKPSYGWGGAMGISQVLPKNWLKMEAKIKEMTGNAIPDPWDEEDSMTGGAIILADLGATNKGKWSEHDALMKYFAGRRWKQRRFQWYGHQIMQDAQKIQVAQALGLTQFMSINEAIKLLG